MMSGSHDHFANRNFDSGYWKSKAVYKSFAAVSGGRHMEPFHEGRLNAYAAHFYACHLLKQQTSCDKVYGNAEDSMCTKVRTSVCLRSDGPDFDPNATTTTGPTTTTTTSTTRGGVSIQNEGSDNCLKSQGRGQLLTEGGDGSCATFTIAGKAFRSEDDISEGACLDWFQGQGWGLWSCHGGRNQQLVDHGSGKWCSG